MMEYLSYSINILVVVVGVVFLFLALFQLSQNDKSLRLNRFRDKREAFVDLLNYAACVDDGVIVCKNGSFMSSWTYEGEDNSSSLADHRNFVAARINQALVRLGSGWMIHVDAIRNPSQIYPDASECHFPDDVSRLIDEERRQFFQKLGVMYDNKFVLTITWFPPLLLERKFSGLMFDDEQIALNKTQQTMALIEGFKHKCDDIENLLSTSLKMKKLGARKVVLDDDLEVTFDDQLSHLHFCATGINQPIQLPSTPIYLDKVIGGQEFNHGVISSIGEKLICTVSIDGFPSDSYPGILSQLTEIPIEYRWSTRFIFMDQHEALSLLEKERKKWRQQIRGFIDQVFNTSKGAINQDAQSMVHDAEIALAEVSSNRIALGYYTSTIVLMDDNRERLEAIARHIVKVIEKLGFNARVEESNTTEAFLGSLPGHGQENLRRPLLNTLNLAQLIPTSTIWVGEEKAPCPYYPQNSPALLDAITAGNKRFKLNLHVSDTGHTFIGGPTGAGKSTLLCLIIVMLFKYRGMRVFAFDKRKSIFVTCMALAGKHFPINPNSQAGFSPLAYLETKEDRIWALDWIETILRLNNISITPKQQNSISQALDIMHNNGDKTLSSFITTVQDELIRETLRIYSIDDQMGHLLDSEHDNLDFSRFNVFETQDIMGLNDKYALPVLLYLFRRIEKSLDGSPTAIVIEEAWFMLFHPVFRDKIRNWLKELRNKNCIVILSTQNISDASKSGIMDVINESTATKIFLPNKDAREEEATRFYKSMGLNSRQIEILAKAIRKREYYVVNEKGNRKFELALGPAALAFCATNDKAEVDLCEEFMQRHGENWRKQWLEYSINKFNKRMEAEAA